MPNFLSTILFVAFLFCGFSSALKEGQTCMKNGNCDAGLHCETCVADKNLRPWCTRIQPLIPTTKVKGLPFNRYTWLTTHNSFARLGAKSDTGSLILTSMNQQDSITDQLNTNIGLADLPLNCKRNGLQILG